MPKKVTPTELAGLLKTLDAVASGDEPAGPALMDAVRVLCRALGESHPGGVLELRVPPYAAVQLGVGQRGAHTRGIPPNVVETDGLTLLRLAAGSLSWPDAVHSRAAAASGPHTDLSEVFPLR